MNITFTLPNRAYIKEGARQEILGVFPLGVCIYFTYQCLTYSSLRRRRRESHFPGDLRNMI